MMLALDSTFLNYKEDSEKILIMSYDSLNRDRLLLILRIYKKIYIFLRFQVSGVRCQVLRFSFLTPEH